METNFDNQYPKISWWVQDGGWIELGRDEYSRSMIKIFDIGGLVWEGREAYEQISEALDEAEASIGRWKEENGYE